MNSLLCNKCYQNFLPALIVFLLLSCSSETNTNSTIASSNQKQEIKYKGKINWIGHWYGEDKRELLIREVGTEFEFINQEIDVNLKFPQEIIGNREAEREADYIIKLINSPKPDYDVVWLESGIYQIVAAKLGDPYWGKKHLVDFSDNKIYKAAHKDFIINNPQYKNQMGGIFAGAFLEGYYYSIWYNKEVAKLVGITIKDFGMTFDDLLQYIIAVDSYNKKNTKHVASFYESTDWITTQILFQNLYNSNLDNDFDDSQAQKSALKKTLQAFEEMGRYKPLIPTHNTNRWFDTRQIPLNDETLFYVHGTWMYSHWRGIDNEKMNKMVPAELPVFKKGSHYLGGYLSSFAVLKNSPNREEAIKFMLFWCQPTIAEQWARYTKNPTGLKGNITSSDMGGDVFETFQSTITNKYGSKVGYSEDASYLGVTSSHNITTKLNLMIIQLLDGGITAEKAYDQLIR